MEQITIVGLVSMWTGIALLPSLAKINKDKDAGDVSPGMLMIFFICFGLWGYYGYLHHEWALVISNSFSWIICVTLFVLYFKYKQKKVANTSIKNLKPEFVPSTAVRKFKPISFLTKTHVQSRSWSVAHRTLNKKLNLQGL